jgi:hypothetical protein
MERVRNDYRDAVRGVADAVYSICLDLEGARSDVARKVSGLRGGGDSSRGRIVTDFGSALERWEDEANGLVSAGGPFARAAMSLDGQLLLMRRRLNELERKCHEEDARQEELPLSALSFL